MKELIVDVLGNAKFFELYTKFKQLYSSRRITILMYHGLCEDNDKWTEGDWLQVKRSEFYKQMCYVKKNFKVLPLSMLLDSFYSSSSSDKPVVIITFDDGYYSTYKIGFPVLKELEICASIFLVTSTIDQDHIFWWDRIRYAFLNGFISQEFGADMDAYIENLKRTHHPHDFDYEIAHLNDGYDEDFISSYRTLRMNEIVEMGKSRLVEFHSHTHEHELLTSLSKEELERTIGDSLGVIKEIQTQYKPMLCYPNGYYNENIRSLTRRHGYKGGVTANPGFFTHKDDVFAIPRIGIGQNMSINHFKYLLSGLWKRNPK